MSLVVNFMFHIFYQILITMGIAKEHFRSQMHGLDVLAVGVLLAVGCLRFKRQGAGGTPVNRGSTGHRE